MSTRHRWLAVYLTLTVCLSFSIFPSKLPATAVNAGGSVGLRELIELALQNDPELVALRLNLPVEEARKRAAWEWRDPEIRFGWGTDDNVQLEQPYTRSGVSRESIDGRSDSRDSSTSSDQRRSDDRSSSSNNERSSSSETGSSAETRAVRYSEKVIPGANFDRIIRRESERRSSNSRSDTRSNTNTTKTEPGLNPTNEIRSETGNESRAESEKFHSSTQEKRYDSRDPFAKDESTSVRARIWLPNPFEMKQRVKRAAKEIDLATFRVREAERNVILTVREDYEELQYLHKKLQASRAKIPVIKAHLAREEALLGGGGEFTIDQSRFENIEIPTLEIDILNGELELENAKRDLAARVGLSDGSRIRLTDPLLRSTIQLQGTDLEYLTRMAFAFRGELGFLQHERAIAESDLAVLKSKRIPTIRYLEAAYGRNETGGYHTKDEYGIQLGVILPLFSWISKDEKVVEAQIEAYYGSLKSNQTNIANEVAEAFRSVKESAKHRNRVEAAVAKHKKMLEATASGLERSEDLAAKEKLRYRIESIRSESHIHLLEADRLYNRSLLRLEQTLGADLDQVFAVKFETFDESGGIEITAAAAASSHRYHTAPKAQPVAKEIVLPSQKVSAAAKVDPKKRWGLLNRPKKPSVRKFKNR